MLRPTAALVIVGVLLAFPSAAGARAQACPVNLLVALPSVGVVTWQNTRTGWYRLRFRVFATAATTRARLVVAGRVVIERSVDPGSTWALPEASTRQRLELTQFTGAGTLRASIDLHFERPPFVVSHCYAYAPPDMTIRLRARR